MPRAPGVRGQIRVDKYGALLASRLAVRLGHACELTQVRVYAGKPDPMREGIAAAAMDKQVAAWIAVGAVVSQRPLRYPNDWPKTPAQQKGVDVQLAIDLVLLHTNKFYDVAIVASTDTDLRPAAEMVLDVAGAYAVPAPIAAGAWNSPTQNSRLWLVARPLWCIYLQRADYDQVEDTSHYGPPKA